MTHPFSSHLGFGNFHTALIADDALVSDSLVFTAVTLPVFSRSENPFTKKTVFFRLERSVIYSLGFCNLAMGPV